MRNLNVLGFLYELWGARTKKGELYRLIVSIIICQMAGIIGSIFTASSVANWYPTLVKPSFIPSGFYIGLIWIVLFTLMGISLFLIWREIPETKRLELHLVSLQPNLLSMFCGVWHSSACDPR